MVREKEAKGWGRHDRAGWTNRCFFPNFLLFVRGAPFFDRKGEVGRREAFFRQLENGKQSVHIERPE